MYLQEKILPAFVQWVKSLKEPVCMKDAKKHARYFIKNHINPTEIPSRGAVYDLFESLSEYYEMHKILHKGAMTAEDVKFFDNMYTLSSGVVWAMEHDAFDLVKYDPIPTWGPDILRVSM